MPYHEIPSGTGKGLLLATGDFVATAQDERFLRVTEITPDGDVMLENGGVCALGDVVSIRLESEMA